MGRRAKNKQAAPPSLDEFQATMGPKRIQKERDLLKQK